MTRRTGEEQGRGPRGDRERAFATVADRAPAVLWLCDEAGGVTYFSGAWYELTGQAVEAGLGGAWIDMVHEAEADGVGRAFTEAVAGRRSFERDYRVRLRDGGYRWVNDRGRPRFDADGTYLGHIGAIVDVHDKVRQTEALREREGRLARMAAFRRSVFELFEEGFATRSPDGFYARMLERAVAVIAGAEAGSILVRAGDGRFDFRAVVGHDFDRLRRVRFDRHDVGFRALPTSLQPVLVQPPLDTLTTMPPDQREALRVAGRMEEIRSVLVIPVVVDGDLAAVLTLDSFSGEHAFGEEEMEMGRIFGLHAATLLRRVGLEGRLRDLAYRDALTGLANRTAFVEAVDRHVAALRGDDGVAILFVDLDDFKPINDSLGHRTGDDVLREVSRRLRDAVGRDGIAARLGGDEFTVVLRGDRVEEAAHGVCNRIRGALEAPVATRGHELHVGASIGISLAPVHGTGSEDLLRRADMAMYEGKKRGKSGVVTFDASMELASRERLWQEEELWRGLERDELELHFQPRVDMASGRIVTLEALLRWRHPERGLLLPNSFLGVTEGSSLVHTLGEHVLHMASRQARRWREAAAPEVRVAVNASVHQLVHPRFVAQVEAALQEASLPPRALELEVQRSAEMHRDADVATRLRELSAAGVGLVLAGFGDGPTSLTRLLELPFHAVKIAPAFVRGVDSGEDGARDLAVVRALTDLGHALGKRVLLQGVESEAAWHALKGVGAAEAQGHLVSPPVAADDVPRLLAAGPIRPVA